MRLREFAEINPHLCPHVTMKKSKTNNRKTFWLGFMLIAGVIPATAQERLEIQVEFAGSVSQSISIPVTRDITVFDIDQVLSLAGSQDDWWMVNVILPYGLTNLMTLDLSGSWRDGLSLGGVFLPNDLYNLQTFDLSGNDLISLTLPNNLPNLRTLNLSGNDLIDITLPDGLVKLETLNLSGNDLISLTLPNNLPSLRTLNLSWNELIGIALPNNLWKLRTLNLSWNELISITLPNDLWELQTLDLSGNDLFSITLPNNLYNLQTLALYGNHWDKHTLLDWSVKLGELSLPWGFQRLLILIGMEIYELVTDPSFRIASYRLKIYRWANGLEISWSGGVLQSAYDIKGPWFDVEFDSPLRLNPVRSIHDGPVPFRFFRLRKE